MSERPFARNPFSDPDRDDRCMSISPRTGERCHGDAGHTGPHGADYNDHWSQRRVVGDE